MTTKEPDPTYDAVDAKPASVQEPDGAEWTAADEAFVDAFIKRNREELSRSLESSGRDLEEGRCVPWEDVVAEIDAMLSSLEAGK